MPKLYGYKNYIYIEVKPKENCLININLNYDDEMTLIPLNKEIVGLLSSYKYDAYYDFRPNTDEVLITVTSLEKYQQVKVYLKLNIINKDTKNDEGIKYSRASKNNYDLKGKTNSLTSSISLKVKNAPSNIRRESAKVRVLINIESDTYISNHKIKILATPVIEGVTRVRPQQKKYYFSGFEKKYTEKTIFTLKNSNKGDDLMIIEISSCKGNLIYALTDTPPSYRETYTQLKKREIPSSIYSSNGKKIITVRNLEEKEYFLTLYGANNRREIDLFLNEEKESNSKSEGGNEVDALFFYYTTTEKRYNYLVTNDSLNYDSNDDFYSVKFTLPELRKRDTFGRENFVDSMNYSIIISNQKKDFIYMESTCYLTKLQQNSIQNKFEDLDINFDEEKNQFIVAGLKSGKTYYMNILGKNEHTGEVITYKPVMIIYSLKTRKIKIGIIILLTFIIFAFLYIAFTLYRKYRLQKLQLNFIEENNDVNSIEKKIGKSNNINLDFVKKKYNDLTEDNQGLDNSD